MVESSQLLMEIRDLLKQALETIDALDDTFLGALIDTALQDIDAKIEAIEAEE